MSAVSLGRLLAISSLCLAAGISGPCRAQELNTRTKADPSTDANTAQIIAEARLKAEQAAGNATLLANHVTNSTVQTDCSMQVGGQQADKQAPAPNTLVGKNGGVSTQNSTVVLGSPVLLCSQP